MRIKSLLRFSSRIAFLATSAFLILWAWKSLFGIDQIMFPFLDAFTNTQVFLFAPVGVGVIWGILLMSGAGDFIPKSRAAIDSNASPAPSTPASAVNTEVMAARTRSVCAPARILAMRPTGNTHEGRVKAHFTLHVTPPGETPWRAETDAELFPNEWSRIQVGSPVMAMYSSADRTAVTIILDGKQD